MFCMCLNLLVFLFPYFVVIELLNLGVKKSIFIDVGTAKNLHYFLIKIL